MCDWVDEAPVGVESSPALAVMEGCCPHHLYRMQLQEILENGQDVEVRGLQTRELLNAVTVIWEPRRRVHIVPGRQANPFLALSESLWLLAGRNDIAVLAPYNKRIHEFSDDGLTLYGAYGLRIRDQIPAVLDRLRADPSDRRAILSIWRPEDLLARTLDPPCNDMVALKLRDNKLHMTVFCRSNDLHWGLYAVNLCQFSFLLEYLAARLRAEVGTQTHISNSLHIYGGDHPGKKVTERMLAHWGEALPLLEFYKPTPLFPTGLPRHEEFVADCNAVLDGEEYGYDGEPFGGGVPFLEFASDYLRAYRECRGSYYGLWWEDIRHVEDYPEWIEAAKTFLTK